MAKKENEALLNKTNFLFTLRNAIYKYRLPKKKLERRLQQLKESSNHTCKKVQPDQRKQQNCKIDKFNISVCHIEDYHKKLKLYIMKLICLL